jgi:hypothetical protein
MTKGVKYGEFSFPEDAGFSGSAGRQFVRPYARGGAAKPFWKKKDPSPGNSKPLTSKQKTAAKARATAAGRPYPNLVDNAAIARRRKEK